MIPEVVIIALGATVVWLYAVLWRTLERLEQTERRLEQSERRIAELEKAVSPKRIERSPAQQTQETTIGR